MAVKRIYTVSLDPGGPPVVAFTSLAEATAMARKLAAGTKAASRLVNEAPLFRGWDVPDGRERR